MYVFLCTLVYENLPNSNCGIVQLLRFNGQQETVYEGDER